MASAPSETSAAEQRRDFRAGLNHASQALALFEQTEDLVEQARCHNMIGWFHALLGEQRTALACCRLARTMLIRLGDRHGAADATPSIGYVHHRLGQFQDAIAAFRSARALFQEMGDRFNEAFVLADLGDAHLAAGEADLARDSWRDGLPILIQLKHPAAEGLQDKLQHLAA